jgi:sulfur carrier protein
MQLLVNGEPREVPERITVSALIAHLGLDGGPVAVERNREIVPRASHATVVLEANDRVEIVHFVGGG